MIGTVGVSLNRLPTARVDRLGTAGASKAGEASPQKAKCDAGWDSRLDIARRSGATADKEGLQTIGLLLLLATLFVIGAGAFAVRHQPAADLPQVGAGFTTVTAGPPAAVVR